MGLAQSGAAAALLLLASMLLATPCRADSESSRVFELIDQRLEHMKDVALYKARNHKPVEDASREAIVVAKAVDKAAKSGLSPSSIEDFYRAQIAAAKVIQYRYLADWTLSGPMPADPPADLVTEVRPALIELGDEIVLAIKRFLETGKRFGDAELEEFQRIVNVEKLDERDERALFDSMRPITLVQ